MASGWREGREPAPQFDTLAYCLTHAITYATQNPLVHYVLNGGPARPDREAGLALRVATLAPYFDAAHYRAGLNEARADALARLRMPSCCGPTWRAAGGRSSARGRTSTRRASCRRGPAAGSPGRPVLPLRGRDAAVGGRAVRGGRAAGRAGGGRGLVPGDLPGCGLTGAVPALCRFGLAGAARSGPGSLDPRRAAAGVRAAAGRAPMEDTGWLGAIGGGLRTGLTTGRSGWTVRRG